MSMPPIPPPPGIDGLSSFGSSAIIASVVSNSEATDAAFWSAKRATFVGSTVAISPTTYSESRSTTIRRHTLSRRTNYKP